MAKWFEHTTWSAQDKADFFAHLKRARATNKAHFLHVQAFELQKTQLLSLHRAALALLDEALATAPRDDDLAQIHRQRGQALTALKRHDAAIDAFREDSFAAQRAYPLVSTAAYLDFAHLIIALKRRELYGEAASALDEFDREEIFPLEQYRFHAAHALISEARGHAKRARESAKLAVEAAVKTESGVRRYRKLRLVDKQTPEIERALKRLSSKAG